jgi:pyridoxine/pyridoxamine 5'-phosphate oxidase
MPGYGIKDSATGYMPWEHVEQQLRDSRNYWICSVGGDGRPHAMPVWGILLDGVVCFSTGGSSRKGRNLARDPHVSVHLESGDDVVIIEGVVEEMANDERFARFREAYQAKYAFRPDWSPDSPTYSVRPERIFAWLEKDFTGTATRWVFDA